MTAAFSAVRTKARRTKVGMMICQSRSFTQVQRSIHQILTSPLVEHRTTPLPCMLAAEFGSSLGERATACQPRYRSLIQILTGLPQAMVSVFIALELVGWLGRE